ncbi:MAG: hypothetical protein WC836_02720 [Desulfobacula sp.]
MKLEFNKVEYVISKTAKELVQKSRVIIAATTSHNPLFEVEPENIKGKTFISIGSYRPDMQEFPDTVIESADDVFVDTLFAIEESGDIANPLKKKADMRKKIIEFSSLFARNTYREGRTVFFKSVGMGLFDLAASSAIYHMALEKKIGQIIDL